MRKYATSVHEFDFVHANNTHLLSKKYDCLLANYVLNILPIEARRLTIKMIAELTPYFKSVMVHKIPASKGFELARCGHQSIM